MLYVGIVQHARQITISLRNTWATESRWATAHGRASGLQRNRLLPYRQRTIDMMPNAVPYC
jgi:hypothetical protein